MSTEADRLRSTFIRYFTEHGHTAVPSMGLIPHDPRAPMFTNAGMNQFIPYFLGDQEPPYRRATSVQKCVRVRGKHDDIDLIGRTTRHGSFFEMLGNFSFGDYFKREAIGFAWELLTERFGLDPVRIWVTVYVSDDEALAIWRDEIGLPEERIQKMEEENFWEMGETGPCGPCSEISYDRGEAFGASGGPANGSDERYLEIWNLVFMQFDRQPDGSLLPLPRPNIDTGLGLERLLTVLEGADSVWETSLLRPVIAAAEVATGVAYGRDPEADVALRVLADHARTMSFLISDGVFPTNEGRGYVLRRIIRRAVLRAQRIGATGPVLASIAAGVVVEMGEAYPQLVRDASLVETVIAHEEEAFLRTLRQGSALLSEALVGRPKVLPGEVAFRLHDTFGFPIELTIEIAAEQGVGVDEEGFETAMAEQRRRARAAAKGEAAGDDGQAEAWKAVLEQFGPSRFVGDAAPTSEGRILAVVPHGDDAFSSYEGERAPAGVALLDVVLDTTPFYAEGGGQVGDTGHLEGATGSFRVLGTSTAIEGITRHTGYLVGGELAIGAEVTSAIDAERRAAIRRNHTATHLLHAALRQVLGEHVGQQGSLVAPDHLRFDFSHFAALSKDETAEVEGIVNRAILSDASVRTYETSRAEAEQAGAMAFFGEKYGEFVRVVEAGEISVELCGGTHVRALGMIGPFRIRSESSIGANTRRIEATTGEASLQRFRAETDLVELLANRLNTGPGEVAGTLDRLLARQRELEEAIQALKRGSLREEANALAGAAHKGRVVARRDGLSANDLRELAIATRDERGIEAVGLIGTTPEAKVGLVVALAPGIGLDAKAIAADTARIVGGGGGGSPELATAGGRDVEAIEPALERLGELLRAS